MGIRCQPYMQVLAPGQLQSFQVCCKESVKHAHFVSDIDVGPLTSTLGEKFGVFVHVSQTWGKTITMYCPVTITREL